jgi:hypothetical protein
MLYLTYTYHLYNREHIKPIRKSITSHLADYPLVIFPMGNEVSLRFETNENAYFIEEKIAELFPEHEFIDTLTDGSEEILLFITRMQEPHSCDDWGRRWNEDTLITEKYFVKKRERQSAPVPETKFYAFFGEDIQEYEVHLGVYNTGQPNEAFVVVDGPFGGDVKPNPVSDVIIDKTQAIWEGIRLMERKVDEDFAAYLTEKKKRKPRKKK